MLKWKLTMHSSLQKFLVLTVLASSLLYGTSYQQFRYFDAMNPGGAGDSPEYISMSHGDYGVLNVSDVGRYRFVIPTLAGGLQKLLIPHMSDSNEAIKLSFYIVNFCFMLVAGMAFFYFLQALGFPLFLSIVGLGMFFSSRIVVLATGTPMIDSFYFAAISVTLLLLQSRKYRLLWFLNPILALSKETIFPFMLLGLIPRENRKIPMLLSLGVSFLVVWVSRAYLRTLVPETAGSEQSSLISIVARQATAMGETITELLTFRGMHDLQNGFSMLLVLAVLGAAVNFRFRLFDLPVWLWTTLLISFVFTLLSDNAGRMFFSSFGIIIPLALIYIYWMSAKWSGLTGSAFGPDFLAERQDEPPQKRDEL